MIYIENTTNDLPFFYLTHTRLFYTIFLAINFPLIAKDLRINDDIRSPRVRLVDGENQIGIVSLQEAKQMASEQDLDLVEVSPHADPPVCKILDYGKYKYHQQKVDHKQRVRSRTHELKTLRLSPNISGHDLETKAKNARRFLEKGHRVKVNLMFRGREITHIEVGEEKLRAFIEILRDISQLEQEIERQGNSLSMMLKPL